MTTNPQTNYNVVYKDTGYAENDAYPMPAAVPQVQNTGPQVANVAMALTSPSQPGIFGGILDAVSYRDTPSGFSTPYPFISQISAKRYSFLYLFA